MIPQLTPDDIDRIGRVIDIDGLAAVPTSLLDQIADDARAAGIRPAAAAVLADQNDPVVARERAFGKLAPGIAHHYVARRDATSAPQLAHA